MTTLCACDYCLSKEAMCAVFFDWKVSYIISCFLYRLTNDFQMQIFFWKSNENSKPITQSWSCSVEEQRYSKKNCRRLYPQYCNGLSDLHCKVSLDLNCSRGAVTPCLYLSLLQDLIKYTTNTLVYSQPGWRFFPLLLEESFSLTWSLGQCWSLL